jgi:glycosyltransferase involved in cell wall biosynthesis
VATVSVVIPFFNAALYLREAVASVLAQTFADWELILVDDGSTDSGTALALDFAAAEDRIRYIEHPGHRNLGQSASRNAGIRAATGEYIALLDADDAWLPTKLERQLAALGHDSGLEMVFGPAIYTHPDGRRNRQVMTLQRGRLQPGSWIPAMLRWEDNAPCPSAVIVRKRALVAVGGFCEELPSLYEDQGTWCKLSLSISAYHDPEPHSLYRIHASSTCGAASRVQRRIARLAFCSWLHQYVQTTPAGSALAGVVEAHLLEAAVRVAAARSDSREAPHEPGSTPVNPELRPAFRRVMAAASVAPGFARILARGFVMLAHARAPVSPGI